MIVSKLQKTEFNNLSNLLREADLPAADIDILDEVYVARVDDEIVGYFALELYDKDALLRSVVITKDSRGRGFGNRMVPFMLKVAQNKKVRNIYLLTTTAAVFFEKVGFKAIERKDAPESITSTREFSQLCPDTAVLMKFELDGKISI